MKFLRWLKHRIGHKLEHIRPSRLMDTIVEHGIALVVIIVAWEIIEDVLFPLMFIWLGKTVNPWFIAGAPVSWLMCLHPIAVPLLWAAWIKFSTRRDNESD